ncbi:MULTISPECIES: glycosyltransferase [Microbacterium]|uniref:nucleotide disphospho-sugar-binding domain-containing protein n=1 Tax=Microbacterium TaxID=33882 RepID=UPI001EF53A3D|nr:MULTISPECIES: glycosyltransferase [Microbacterium]
MPLLTIARHLVGRGDRVRFLTGRKYGEAVTASGARFIPLPVDADIDLDRANELFPERAALTGAAGIRFDLRNLFIAPARDQLRALEDALAAEPADAILTEGLFVGAAFLNQRPRAQRPAIIPLGIFPLGGTGADLAPFGTGLPPMAGPIGRLRNRALRLVTDKAVFGPVLGELDAACEELTGRPLDGSLFDRAPYCDAYVQFTVPSFEYPRADLPSTVRFAGPLPSAPSRAAELPEWWAELDDPRPVVHVTQGTVANRDFSLLVRPAIDGLADRDVLVVVSTGGRPPSAVGPVPRNVRVERYLPYDLLLPKVDALVSNGGYGGVQQALSHGIPLVVAGQTEDKIEVTARVGWSGAGINLRTNRAEPAKLARAVDRVLGEESYRTAARRIGDDIRATDALATLDAVLAAVIPREAAGEGPDKAAATDSAADRTIR